MRQIPAKIWVPVMAVILAAVSLAVILNLPKEEKAPEVLIPEKITPEIPTAWQTYRSQEYGFEVSYPQEAIMKEEGYIELPFTPGTTLVEKNLIIGVTPQCESLEGVEIREPETFSVGELEFTKEAVGEAAMGSVYEYIRYSLTKDNHCFYLNFTLHSIKPGGLPTPLPDFDYEKETEIFDRIVSTFRFLKEEGGG